ncbi:hypothetical protein A1Q1_02838 [Trichosporon asahii var. asahii CBS 2479]|uniref:Prefoldin subunit 1 n=1 Tax=Trichosporon asahii var. asahii (strain ATCC 90039 / CBS 2479 / JCM 2466 / KCTC 7840 / NBRC 103889/ NCYC 2677 / UAMH 7654) TaxID=1186058 RepID=J6EU87_TRIAS|nr:hypothetical protein A1Q1_02838 [Trichosporon asahii var. asahii CBS 2479]EJT48134.1 hypothetical protein A1Q1_02838 [Trichosporon asahii var. asahii CBS 2479]
MSNLSDDTLRKILQQIQTQAINGQRQSAIVRAQIQQKEKEKKILELTMRELASVPEGEGKLYRGVGKILLGTAGSVAFDCCFSLILAADLRFIEQSRSSINGRHKSLETSLGEDISSLQKKQKYYDRQVEEANGQLRDISREQ